MWIIDIFDQFCAKVILGPFDSEFEAERTAARIDTRCRQMNVRLNSIIVREVSPMVNTLGETVDTYFGGDYE